uniref:Flap endonuclease GEN-like 2 n=1 Tax=Anthurium amnicola TaxID=1678845 RepID=A0A1D1ZCF1_9ARAE
MGVKNLWDILECCKQTLPLQHLQNKRLCVDLSCWMVQFRNACRSPACVREKLYLRTLFHRLRALISLNCSLIFVTDGSIPAIKLAAYRRRLGTSSEATGEEPNSHVSSLRRNRGSEFSCMIKEAKALGTALGIPCLDGVEEAEAQCASLNSATLCDGCFTADSDIFLFGARTVYRDIFLGENGYVVCYDMVDIEQKLGFRRNSLITLALLLGSDYSQGVRGFGPETACQLVKSMGDDTILEKIFSGQLTFTRTAKRTKRKGEAPTCDGHAGQDLDNVQNLGKEDHESNDQFLEVVNAYLKPKCHPPDSEVVQRVCVHLPFRHFLLQQMCKMFFHWDSDKTDQYILPKIAERNLRRFANFRTTSEELGIRIPLQEMPITCPAFTIIKQRKLLGRECFEVSWQDVGRLVTSTVSADLLKSACPEKVAEFLERNAECKKQQRKPRQKKSERGVISEVDLQLQTLLLNIESENELSSNSTSTSNPVRSNKELDVIDLSTPSPPLRACKMAKCEDITSQYFSVMDLGSETDITLPERMDGGFNAFDLAACEEDVRQCTDASGVLLPSYVENSLECSGSDAIVFEKTLGCHFDVVDLSPVEQYGQKCDSKRADAVESNASKHEIGRHTDVIDIYDSESDASPEHQRKARELRLFIGSIKGDLYD